ncbi:hypothetical protein AJ80_01083 [Polytolypa hystricis UAMH7299]|uniref:Signal peptidase subunit 3 n=1 Tax=Polytolypa hystricis (strain UAMH7299) TaxID=1447883 RepID=A0A2B7Z2R6_POLH7|nr:hypothetical protein AJ80_01083 [Polytolypa hystricis UAMH7299]
MHSALNRIQGVFGYFTTVAFVLGALTAFSVVLFPADPVASLELKNVQVIKGRPHYYSTKREEYAQIRFDLDADLSSLFNWNTKQLFVYVLASYPSSSPSSSPSSTSPASNTTTESIIWDTIIPAPVSPYSLESLMTRFFPSFSSSSSGIPKSSKSNKSNKKKPAAPVGVLRLRDQKPKYQITDITGTLTLREGASLVLGWNVQPWIGPLQWGSPQTNIASNLAGDVLGLGFITSGGERSGGRSKKFDFPPLKGSAAATAAAAAKKAGENGSSS